MESLREDAIDTPEIPELDDDFWENAQSIVPENYLQIEHEILEWFKGRGQDYHTRINIVLRTYMDAHR
ncbi:BrnA antitoxin family protein [Candidatus Poribacteria bacterium]|nr:BrnA antitoxin family protein [Candidatus Poribacteria bacterium]